MSWGHQASGTGDLENANGDDIGDYTTQDGGAVLNINGNTGVWSPADLVYYFPDPQNPSYRLSLSCMASTLEHGCIRWRVKKETLVNGQWVEEVGSGNNQLVRL